MADRYWVGGTGTWDGTNTANWSTSSGGATGASVPTATDNVFFDANSNVGTGAFTVTMATTPRVCNDFTASGLDGVMTLAGLSIDLNVSGSLTFPATNFTRSYTGITTFNATSTGKTVTTNGVGFGARVTFNGIGGGWTLGSAFSSTELVITNGTFDTSSVGNYAVTVGSFSSANTNTRTINLNGSTVTINNNGGIFFISSLTGLTFNAGTSQINITSVSNSVDTPGITFYNVAFTSTNLFSISITGANTFNNLSITNRTTVGLGSLSFSANQTINGTFTVSAGTASAYRTMIASNTIGTTRTLTCAAVSFTDTDFRDITIAGAASPASGTRLGDCKGNNGITFPAAKTVYYRQTGTNSWGASGSGSWSATSGGALDATQFPLAQDTAIFPAATYPASGSTTTINSSYNIGTIDMSLRTSNTMTLSNTGGAPSIYGNWINGTGTTLSSANTITFAGRTTQTITSAGISFTQPITINSPSGSVTLQDALTTGTTSTTTLTSGTLDLQSYTLSTGIFSSSNSNTRTIAFGTGNITLTGNATTIWNCGTLTNFSYTGTSDVWATYSGATGTRTITHGSTNGTAVNAVNVTVTNGSDAISFGASIITLNNLTYNNTFTGTASLFANIYGNLTLSTGGTIASSSLTSPIFKATSGTKTITSNGKTIDRPVQFDGVGGTWQLQDAMTIGATSTSIVTLTNGTLDLNGKTLTTGSTATSGFFTGVGTKNLTFNAGTLVIPSSGATSFNNATPTNFTTTAGTGTGTISMTAATAKTFVGGGSTFNCTLNQGGAGALTITGSNTFTSISNSVQPTTFTFTAGTTTTVTNWNVNGTAGNLVTIGSATAASHTLSKASGTVSSDFLSISRSTATGGASWYAGANSTDGGNNSGWIFTAPPAPSGSNSNFLMFFQ